MLLVHNHHVVVPKTNDLYLYMPNKIMADGTERLAEVRYFNMQNQSTVVLDFTPRSPYWVELYLDGFRIINHRYPTYRNSHIPFEDYNVEGNKIFFTNPITGNLKVVVDTVGEPIAENNFNIDARGLRINFINIQSYDEYTKRFNPARYASGNVSLAANVNIVGWYNTALTNRVSDSLYAEPLVIHQPHWNAYVRPTKDRKALLYVPGKNFQGIDCFTYTMITQHGQIGPVRTIYINVFGPQPPERYTLLVDKEVVGEGEPFVVTLETESIEWGVPVPYTITGTNITTTDLGLVSLTGNFIPVSTGNATIARDSFTANVFFDGLPEGVEYVTVFLTEKPEIQVNVAISDVTFTIVANRATVQEGETVTFTLTTEGVPDNRTYDFTMFGSNITSGDVTIGTLTGQFTVVNNTSSITRTLTRDYIREGVETLNIRLNLYPFINTSVQVLDTNFNITVDNQYILRGESVTFTLNAEGAQEGREVPYRLKSEVTTLQLDDLGLGSNSGIFTIAGGQANITINTPIQIERDLGGDFAIELTEDTFIHSPLVNVAARTYSFTSNRHLVSIASGAITEGETIAITLTTTGFINGAALPYAITGYSNLNQITAEDFIPPLLTIGPDSLDRTTASLASASGYFTIIGGLANVVYRANTDSIFEGGPTSGERFDVELIRRPLVPNYNNQIYTVYIRDPEPTFSVIPSSTTVNEGNVLNFTIRTTSIQDNTTVYYRMNGIQLIDWVPNVARVTTTVIGPESANIGISVNQLYDQYLGRTAAQAELDYWVNEVINNNKNLIMIEAEIAATPEAVTANSATRTGSLTINNNFATLNGFTVADRRTEGTETLIFELLTGSLAGPIVASNNVVILDTSQGPAYVLTSNRGSIDEGETVRFTVSTTNVLDYTTLYYRIQTYFYGNITALDFTDSLLLGNGFVVNNKVIFDKTASLDNLTEDFNVEFIGYEAFQFSVFKDSNLTQLIDSTEVYVYDTSRSPGTYAIVPRSLTVNEGSAAIWDITTTNVYNNTKLYWTNSGNTVASDFNQNINSGNVTIINNQAVLTLNARLDLTTEGPEYANISLRLNSISGEIVANSAPVMIVDTSKSPPTYRVTPDSNVKNEGQSLTFTVNTTFVEDNTELFYAITGVSILDYVTGSPGVPSDQSPVALAAAQEINQYYIRYLGRYPEQSGLDYWVSLVVSNTLTLEQVEEQIRLSGEAAGTPTQTITGNIRIFNNTATIAGIVVEDFLTEGVENLVLTLRTGAASGPSSVVVATANTVRINDTSISSIDYRVTPNVSVVAEGGVVKFDVNVFLLYTTIPGVPNGTVYYYQAVGTNIVDDFAYRPGTTQFSNNGTVTINNGVGSFLMYVDNDYFTEGTESFYAELRSGGLAGTLLTSSTPVEITDSSLTPVITIIPNISNINETNNRTVVFTITFDNRLPVGTIVYWDLSGTASLDDFSSRPGGDSFAVPALGVHTMSFTVLEDYTTEGNETIILNIRKTRLGRIYASSSSNIVNIADTSQSLSLSVLTNNTTFNEGDTINVTVSGNNIPTNFKLYLRIYNPSDSSTPASYNDFTDWSTPNNPITTVTTPGAFSFSTTRTLLNDLSYNEGLEKFRFEVLCYYSLTSDSITGKPSISVFSQDITVLDSSRTLIGNMILRLTPTTFTVNLLEGTTGWWVINTSYPEGTSLYWDVAPRPGTSGFNASRDLTKISGTTTVGSTGQAGIYSFGAKTVAGVQTTYVAGINQRSFYLRIFDAPGGTLLGSGPFIGILDLF